MQIIGNWPHSGCNFDLHIFDLVMPRACIGMSPRMIIGHAQPSYRAGHFRPLLSFGRKNGATQIVPKIARKNTTNTILTNSASIKTTLK
jgi:hypothetical protein